MVRKLPKSCEDSFLYFRSKYGNNIFQVNNDGNRYRDLRKLYNRGYVERIPTFKIDKIKKNGKKYFWKIKSLNVKF